ncbi:piggyBac transposable element-derived protein 4-like [Colias croceus]|uniref:piggyBac transposable element-derived protein 4-like n=1 Tax=Colias crocea TaxID=72248 RepID=UPI001E27CFF3|nr:piggyBac transposable element-derived protein 4-like [Colias croceus]
MSSGHNSKEPPADFLNLLYADEKEEYQSDEGNSDVEDDYEGSRSPTPVAPLNSPLTSPKRESIEGRSDLRARSRSPIWLQPSESAPRVVVQIYDEDGTPLEAEDTFLTADAHTIFVSPNLSERGRSGRRSRRRVGGRGDRGGRVRSVRVFGQGRRGPRWEVGHPLNEIWVTDDDVPDELRNMVMDVINSRMQGRDRNRPERGTESENEDVYEFFDADECGDFEWASMESFQGKEETFLPAVTGSTRVYNSAYDAFRSYWDDDILGLIVSETNQYASQIASSSFQSEWYATNIHEILCLFSFWMMLGIIKMPTITSCFSTHPLLMTEVFQRIFIRKRYENLSRALHFIDTDPANLSNNTAKTSDRLYRLRPIISHLNAKFQSNYVLDKDICIDESLTLWKGRLDIKQYIKTKASKFGIKTFELCESVTGYLWSFIVYTGKQSSADLEQAHGVPKSTAVVKKLMAPLLNKGYRLFMDNWYNSPLLARFLKRNGTDCIGTLRPSLRDVPVLINKAPLKRGEIIARHSGDVSVLSWQDKKRVTMISTCHGSYTALPRVPSKHMSRPVPFKPQVVLDYNKFMGGVDLKDQMLEPYLLERKRCQKWYMKLFKRLVNVSILNSRILLQSSTNKVHDHLVFRLQLVDSILAKHLSHCPQGRSRTVSSNRSQHQELGRLIPGAHWPTLLTTPQTGGNSAENRTFRKRCVVCLREGRKTIKTTFSCETCGVPLCIQNCFKSYHIS